MRRRASSPRDGRLRERARARACRCPAPPASPSTSRQHRRRGTSQAPRWSPRRVSPPLPARPARREGGSPWHRSHNLEIGRVVAVLAGHEHVLAGTGRREEADAELPTHDPALRLDVIRLELTAVEDPSVGAAVPLEALARGGLVAIERVGVLHDELAHPQQASPGTRLVAVLDREVVPELRQLLVRAELARVEGHRLLVRHRQDEPPAGPVLQVEDLRDLGAPGRLPELDGREQRH